MNKGLTLVELLVGIAIGLILLGAVALFLGRGVNLSREQTEQERTTEDARLQMEKMSDAIRDARSFDLTGDGLATFAAEMWLQRGEDRDIQFYTNLDTDDDLERLHYWLEGTNLNLGVKDPYTIQGEEKVTTLAKSLRNFAQGKPLFRYYAAGSDVPLLTPVLDPGLVQRVEIMLSVDVSEAQAPGATEISTVVAPRASVWVLVSPTPSVSPTPTFFSPSPSLPPSPSPSFFP